MKLVQDTPENRERFANVIGNKALLPFYHDRIILRGVENPHEMYEGGTVTPGTEFGADVVLARELKRGGMSEYLNPDQDDSDAALDKPLMPHYSRSVTEVLNSGYRPQPGDGVMSGTAIGSTPRVNTEAEAARKAGTQGQDGGGQGDGSTASTEPATPVVPGFGPAADKVPEPAGQDTTKTGKTGK